MKNVSLALQKVRFRLFEMSVYFPAPLLLYIQRRKLHKLLSYAKDNTIFFRKKFTDQSIDVETFELLPIETRADIKESGEDMVNKLLPSWMYGVAKGGTSGTTGEPIRFYNTAFGTDSKKIQILFMYLNIYRSVLYKNRGVTRLANKMRIAEIRIPDPLELERVHEAKERHLFIDHKDLKSNSREIVEKVFQHRPDIFGCYASSTIEFCKYVEEYGYRGKIKIPYIINSGEVLLPNQKIYIEQLLGGKVYNRYGAAEFGTIAAEYEGVEGYVSSAESFVIEIVDENNKSVSEGEIGRVLVTDLTNYTQPFIRYELGDLALLHEKRPPYIRFSLQGRNRFVTFGSKRLSHFELNGLFAEHAEAIVQYQIVKKSTDTIEVRIVKNNLYYDFMTTEIIQHIHAVVGEHISVAVNFVDSIPRIGRGKTLVYIEE